MVTILKMLNLGRNVHYYKAVTKDKVNYRLFKTLVEPSTQVSMFARNSFIVVLRGNWVTNKNLYFFT